MDAESAELRMARLENVLRDVVIEGVAEPMSIGVSWGFRDFSDAEELEEATKKADADMYARKHERKTKKMLQHVGLGAMVSDLALPQRS